MSDDLQKALAEAVRLATLGLKDGKEFVVAQAPDLIQQLLRWKFWSHSADGVLWTAVAVLSIWVTWRAHRYLKENDWPDNPLFLLYGLPIFSLLAFHTAYQHFCYVLQIVIAPKIFLIEWAMAQVAK